MKYEYIKSATTTSTTSLTITDCFSASYDNYYVSISLIDKDTNGSYIHYRYLDNTNTPITTASYDWCGYLLDADSVAKFSIGGSEADTRIRGIQVGGNGANENGGVALYIFKPFDNTTYTTSLSQGVGYFATFTTVFAYKTIGMLKGTTQCKGLYFLANTGGYDNLTVDVYGIK